MKLRPNTLGFALILGCSAAFGCKSSGELRPDVPELEPITIPAEAGPVEVLPETDADPSVKVGLVEVVGGAVSDASEVASGLEPELQRCSTTSSLDWSKTHSSAEASRLEVKAKVGPNGEVRFAKLTGGAEIEGRVLACLTGRVAAAQFAPPRGADPTVVIPIAIYY